MLRLHCWLSGLYETWHWACKTACAYTDIYACLCLMQHALFPPNGRQSSVFNTVETNVYQLLGMYAQCNGVRDIQNIEGFGDSDVFTCSSRRYKFRTVNAPTRAFWTTWDFSTHGLATSFSTPVLAGHGLRMLHRASIMSTRPVQ